MAPRPYSDKSSLPTDSSNDVTSEIPNQDLPETPSPPTFSGATTPSPTPQEQVPVEPFTDTVAIQENNRTPYFGAAAPCYPTPGDIMPYDHSLPDFIRQITNQSNLANLHSLSLRVISTLISLHRMSTYLPNLRYLDLEGSVLNSLRDIGCSFKNLQILKVGRCQLESLDGTFGLSSLRELYAEKNFINDISPCSNLPHIRHIDVSGNRIRNISYAGFLSVCNKLKSIVFTGNPATEVSDYRKHVRRILPQLETLDGISFMNEELSETDFELVDRQVVLHLCRETSKSRRVETCTATQLTKLNVLDNADDSKEAELIEQQCETSDSSSTSAEALEFSSVSLSGSMNNFYDSEENFFCLDKKNKQAKNLANQDQADDLDIDTREVSTNIKTSLAPKNDSYKGQNAHSEQTKITEIRSVSPKQKCASVLKLDKDNENRSKKKTNFSSSEKFNEAYASSSTEASKCLVLEQNNSTHDDDNVSTKIHSFKENSKVTGSSHNHSEDVIEEKFNSGAVKKTTLSGVSKPTISAKEQMLDRNFGEPSKLATGSPVCGNLAAALRNRKKIMSAWDEEDNRRGFFIGEDPNKVQINGSRDGLDIEPDADGAHENDLIEEDVLATSKKWREAFRRFRSNNRARWEAEPESEFTNILEEVYDLDVDKK